MPHTYPTALSFMRLDHLLGAHCDWQSTLDQFHLFDHLKDEHHAQAIENAKREIFEKESESSALNSYLKDVTFFDNRHDDDWTAINYVDDHEDIYYYMAKSDGEKFFAPDLEGVKFYSNGILSTVKRIDMDCSFEWHIVPTIMPSNISLDEELPRGNFWA